MISNPPLSALILITPGAEEFAQRSPHGAGTMDGVLIAALVLLCQICWAGALNAGVGRALSLLRLMAGQRLDACDPVGGGLGAFVTIYYNILSFNDKPIGLYRIMLFIFCRDGYGAIRTRPPQKK